MNLMWSMVSGLSSLFSQNKVEEYTEKDFTAVLFTEKTEVEEEKPKQLPESVCQHRIGTITKLQSDYGMIDNRFYFDLCETEDDVKEGDVVTYVAYRSEANSEWKVKQVALKEKDDWGSEGVPDEVPSLITSENYIMPKKVIAQIIDKHGRMLVLDPGDIVCNLDKVKADFLPMEGDWVELNVLAEINENDPRSVGNIIEVKQIKALRSKSYNGNISHLEKDGNDFMGIINSEVYFNGNVCEPSYDPKLGDMVVAHIIESFQGALVWRAINVVPVTTESNEIESGIEEERLFDSKNGISLMATCTKQNLKIGEETEYEVLISNEGNEVQFLVSATLRNFKTSEVMRIITNLKEPVAIAPCENFSLNVHVKPISSGYFTETLVLTFKGGWTIGSMLFIFVDHPLIINKKILSTKSSASKDKMQEKRKAAEKKLLPTKVGFVVPGVRPIKPASFIPNRLDVYPIPKNITNILISTDDTFRKYSEIEGDLIKLFPCMTEELNEKNYLVKLHNLLHIEDQEMSIAIKKYDRERINFDRRGEFLTVSIPNLAESRPSLVIGDKLIASDPVVFRSNGTKYEAYIHKVLSDAICVKFNEAFQSSYNGKDYNITFIHSRTGIRRSHQAINLVHKNLGASWLFPDTLNLKPPMVTIKKEYPPVDQQTETIHSCVTSYETLNGSINSKNVSKKYKMSSLMENEPMTNDELSEGGKNQKERELLKKKFMNSRSEKVLKWVNSKLNFYQKEAVRNILKGVARPLPYVIFGPPGTGKTVTVVETILQIVHQIPHSRLLVATPSNSSADLICSRLLSWDLLNPGDLVRIVGYNYMIDEKMPAIVKPYCTVVDMKNAEGSYEEDGIRYSSKQAIGRHRITIGTCVSLGVLYTMGFPRNHFTHVIIDEAGQSKEPEIAIPLAFLNNESHAVLAGDPRQLGPVIISRVAESLGLGESLLDRLLMRFPYHRDPESYPKTNGYDPRLVTWLLCNYRSLSEILNLYSNLFYDSKLIPKICDKCSEEAVILRKIAQKLPSIRPTETGIPTAVIFHGVRGVNAQDDDSPSWYNDHEIVKVMEYLQDLYACDLKSSDIGIITPYQKQVHKIREMVRMYDLDVPKIGSVEEFQGQERKAIILSTVRSDEGLLEKDKRFALGFVASKQRLNVAISRARCLLIIIGNPHLLVKDISWRHLLRICVESKAYTGCDLPTVLTR